MLGHEVDDSRHQIERNIGVPGLHIAPSERLYAPARGRLAFQVAIDRRSLIGAPAMIFSSECDARRDIECEEALAGFWRSIDDREPDPRNDTAHQIASRRRKPNVVEVVKAYATFRCSRRGRRASTTSGDCPWWTDRGPQHVAAAQQNHFLS